jgi:outer membrane receptor protein involved in Fe transport
MHHYHLPACASRVARFLFALCLALGLSAAGARAQSNITSGAIQGLVTDANGAAVPGATVEAKNTATNAAATFTSDEDGRFVFLQLQPGPYVVTVTKTGFNKLVQENLALTVGQTISLNLALKTGDVTATVTVAAAPTVDTIKTESSSTINQATVETTPVLGRKFEDLLTLTPGVSIVQGPDGDVINFNGQRGVFNNVSLDGGDYNNGFFGEQAGGQRTAVDITLEAVQEFQVVATGANAEFGRTAGGVVNVITKSGTNDVRGSLFHFQRLEKLTANTSDGQKLNDFRREQFGGTIGGPFKRDKSFFFVAAEGIRERFTRANLSAPLGACPVTSPTLAANEALLNTNAECQRLALLSFFRTRRNQEEGQPVERLIRNGSFLGKLDNYFNDANKLATSINFVYSKNTNQTFDVPTYGNSANGIEGPSKIFAFNNTLFSTISATKLNELQVTYTRENRPRSAINSNVPADTAMGFATTFRFGNPFFLNPTIDEVFQRFQVRDNFSLIAGRHTVKFGGEYLRSKNVQVFRGFFTGRYIFDSVVGFLRYTSAPAAGGFGPQTVGCSNGAYVTAPTTCPAGTTPTGGPLLLFLQGAGRTGPATDAAGASDIKNDDYAFFVQDKWQVRPNFTLNLGLRYEAQIFPDVTVPPAQTAYGIFLTDPRFPSDGTIPNAKNQWQPRLGFAWNPSGTGKSALRGSFGIYYGRQNMLTQVGAITTNGVQQQTIFVNTDLIRQGFATAPTWPGLVTPAAGSCTAGTRTNPFPCFSGVRAFSRDYENPRIYTYNLAYEQEVAQGTSVYFDFTASKGVHLTRFINLGRGPNFAPFLGDVFIIGSQGKSFYRGFTAGLRSRYGKRLTLDMNYVVAKDEDDDSNERDPFTDRSFDINNLSLDYALSDRDIRHKFNLVSQIELGRGFQFAPRIQARTAQPITPATRTATNRNSLRKNNEYFSFDWRFLKVFKLGERYELIPQLEMFNTFNTENNINPLITPGLFNFDGFLRQGVGDPRQLQLSIKFKF